MFGRCSAILSLADRLDPRVITSAWTNRRVRLAYAGYL